MRVAVAGVGTLAATMLDALLKSSHDVVAVIQNGRAFRGWRRWLFVHQQRFPSANPTVLALAQEHNLPVIWIDTMTKDELAPLSEANCDVLLVGGFSIILKKLLIDMPRIACINAHSSLLPKHRGPNPFTAVLLAGEAQTGLTFHLVEEGIDTGPILSQHSFAVTPHDSALSIHRKACLVAGRHVVALLDDIEQNGLHAVPQDHALATYDKRPNPEDARINWQESAQTIEQRARAFYGFEPPHFYHGRLKVLLRELNYDPTPVNARPGQVIALDRGVTVATGLGTVTITEAFCGKLFPRLWPSVWNVPKVGEALV